MAASKPEPTPCSSRVAAGTPRLARIESRRHGREHARIGGSSEKTRFYITSLAWVARLRGRTSKINDLSSLSWPQLGEDGPYAMLAEGAAAGGSNNSSKLPDRSVQRTQIRQFLK
jgi:hypothetical protein